MPDRLDDAANVIMVAVEALRLMRARVVDPAEFAEAIEIIAASLEREAEIIAAISVEIDRADPRH